MMLISLINFITLWDGIKHNERTGIPTLKISGRRPVCAIFEIGLVSLTLGHIYLVGKSVTRLSDISETRPWQSRVFKTRVIAAD